MKSRSRVRRRRSPLWRWITWSLATAMGVATGVFGWPQLMERLAPERSTIASLQISGNLRVAPEDLVALSGITPGTPLRQIDPEVVAERIRSHPWIAQARVTALPPERLLVGVEERTPRALTRADDGLYFVDGGGVAFAPAPDGELPELVASRAIEREVPDPALVEGIQILDALAREGLPAPRQVEVGETDGNERPAFSWQRGDVTQRVVLGSGRFQEKLARLARLLRADLSDVRGADHLDLRFSGRVILRAAGENTEIETDAPETPDVAARGA